MDIQTVTVELLRAGPRHNQLLSPITQYLGVCGNSPASRVTLPYEHGEIERRLQELRYGVSVADEAKRASHVLEQTGRELAQVLSSIDGVAGALNPKQDCPGTLTHLRIVLSASELAMLPFEASKVPTGTGASSVWLALQARAPVCVTRHIRSVSAEGIPWPSTPRILFIAGPETPVKGHRDALEKALYPWRTDVDRAWARVSLSEFALLWLAVKGLSEPQREEHARAALHNARAVVDLVGRGSEHVSTTSRQFNRYVDWVGQPGTAMAAHRARDSGAAALA